MALFVILINCFTTFPRQEREISQFSHGKFYLDLVTCANSINLLSLGFKKPNWILFLRSETVGFKEGNSAYWEQNYCQAFIPETIPQGTYCTVGECFVLFANERPGQTPNALDCIYRKQVKPKQKPIQTTTTTTTQRFEAQRQQPSHQRPISASGGLCV